VPSSPTRTAQEPAYIIWESFNPPTNSSRALWDPKVQSQRLHQRLSMFYESVNPDRLGNVSAIVKLFEGKNAISHPLTSDSRVHRVNQQSLAAVLTAQAEGRENRDAAPCSWSHVII
jgi:hypothetical protein